MGIKSNMPEAVDIRHAVVVDVETTGLDYKTERIIELAAVQLDVITGEMGEQFSSLVNPGVPIRHSSFQVHGISQADVADAPTIDQVLPAFLELVGDRPYIAHGAVTDYTFINQACKTVLGRKFDNRRIDTFDMYLSVFPDESSHGLSSLLRRFGFDDKVNHRALDDTLALAQVYPQLRKLYEQKQAWNLSQLPYVDYLVERYLRLQRTAQVLHAEMADLKTIFKLHFAEGGQPITASTGETLTQTVKRNYDYDEDAVRQVLAEAGLVDSSVRVDKKTIEKIINRRSLPPGVRDKLKNTRRTLVESRSITFLKPDELPPGGP